MTKTFTVNQVPFTSIKAAADHFGVPYRTVQSRLKRGATIEEALGQSKLTTRTCTWCQREWPLSNFDGGKGQCKGCRNLQRNHGMSLEEVQLWAMHQEGPRCGVCREGYDQNGGPLRWAEVYRGEETEGYRFPLCEECSGLMEMSRERFGYQVGQKAGLAPKDVVARLIAQDHMCPSCSKALHPNDTVFVRPALIHAKCRLTVQ